MKPATTIVTLFLIAISIAQLLRVIFQVDVVAGGIHIPLWASILASIGSALLAFFLWREHRD